MEIVKEQLRKPNFLIMVESPASMQGLPGENPARYNEVGADCQNGDRYCRLYGQPNRCEFSGMGGQGYKFDFVSAGTALQTQTQSETLVTSTTTLTRTGTGTLTDRLTVVVTSTSSTPAAATISGTGTTTLTVSRTGTGSQTATPTVTRTATSTNTGTATPTQSQTAATTNTGTTTSVQSQTATTTNTGTTTSVQSQTVTTTNTGTTTSVQSQSATTTNTGTTTSVQSQSVTTTNTGTTTQVQSQSVTTTNTGTTTPVQSQSVTTTNTGTTTPVQSRSVTSTNTGTVTPTTSYVSTSTYSSSSSSTTTSTQTTTSVTTSYYDSYPSYEIGHWGFDDTASCGSSCKYKDDWGNTTATGFQITTDTKVFGTYAAAFYAGSGASTNTNVSSVYARLTEGSSPYLPAAPDPTAYTVAVWVNPNTVAGEQAIVTYLPADVADGFTSSTNTNTNTGTSTSTSTEGFRLMFHDTSSHHIWVDANRAGHQYINAGDPTSGYDMTNHWSLVVVTMNGATWTLRRYHAGACTTIDGDGPDGNGNGGSVSTNMPTAILGGGAWRVGASGDNKNWQFYGSIDELHFWNTVISETAMESLCACNRTDCTYVGPTTSSSSSSATSTVTAAQYSTTTLSAVQSQYSTSTLSAVQSQYSTATLSAVQSQYSTTTLSAVQSQYSTSTLSAVKSQYSTSTLSAVQSQYATGTITGVQSQYATGTITGVQSQYATGTVTGVQSQYATGTITGVQSQYATGTVAGTQGGYSTTTILGSATAYSTSPTTEAATATSIASASATVPSIVTFTDLGGTETLTATDTLTATGTTISFLKSVPDLTSCNDPGAFNCTWLGGITSSYCYLNSTVQCYSSDDCTSLTKGDFCRFIDTSDGSGRLRNDFCASGTTKTCRYNATTPCNNDSQCDSGKGDYCVYGKAVNMCQNTGLWCTDDGLGCDASSGDGCVPATSRMMMVKNAVRRVVLEHAYDDTAVVKIGQMHTYQAGGGSTDNLFPYVKLNTTSTGTSFLTSTRVDTKFLPRSELLKGVGASGKACFSSSTGPSSSCTIDYSGGGASVNTPTVSYSLVSSGNDSRYAVPSGDGKTYYRQDSTWSSCGSMCYFAGAGSSGGEGIYEGSYYTFSYVFGTPVVGTPSDPAGTGSLYAPKYSTTYLGKSYGSAGNYWYLMDAERTEFVNENKYGAREFSGLSGAGAGLPWSQGYVPTGDEYPLPLTGASGDPTSTSSTCSASNGAQWDHNVVPMVNDTSLGGNSSLKPTQKALLNAARLDKASYGGIYATGHIEPIACALKNDGQNDKYHSIDNYMSIVQGNDTINNGGTSPCWENHVLMVVDGLPRGPGDVAVGGVDCSADACKYDPSGNPNLTGCNCPAVTKARALAANGVDVHVIAATTDLSGRNTYAAATLNNVARAGSTSPSFINIPRYAASEDQLYYWLNYEMKEALRMTVATTPASAASGSQSLAGVTAGNMLFQTTVELPEWRGSLVGFSIGTATATTTTTATASVYTTQLAWNAATVNAFTVRPGFAPTSDQQKLWMQRQVFFSDGSGHVHQIAVGSDGTIDSASKTTLQGLGLGGNVTETERIVQWMLGKIDPTDTTDHKPLNPAVMGSVVNSMPIDVGAPGISLYPGGTHFFYAHASRPELVYLGADDGMLHAFHAGNGMEAFAFIPVDMIPVIAKLYAQGGQRYSPNDHIYGLAGSPKVKNLCVANCVVANGLTCSDVQSGVYQAGCPDWRTILVMGEGPGGNHPFALDITDPVESGNATLSDAALLWHVGYKNASGILAANLGETDSTAAFAYHRTSAETDNRVLMASGYPLSGTSTTTKLIDAMMLDGSIPSAAGSGATIGGSGSCDASTGQEFAVLTDVAVARDNFHNGTNPADQNLLAAYVGDTWGTLHQYAPSFSPALDKGGAPMALGCNQPLHFSPAVVQLNRNNSNNPDNSVYLAQVTNSILDPVTVGSSFPASMLVVGKLSSIGSAPPALDQTFGTSGLIKLPADTSQGTSNRLCGVTTVVKTSSVSDCGTGGSWLPATARPTGTPVAVVRTDGTGFQLYTTWYDPPKANWDTCPESATSGNSYVTLHEFLSNGTWAQIAGREYPRQYVTGVQFVGSTLFITFGTNTTTPNPTTDNFGQTFSPVTSQSLSALSGDRFIKTAWTERMDVD